MRPHPALLALAVCVFVSATPAVAAPDEAPPPPFPSELQATANELSARLADVRASLPPNPPRGAKPLVLAAELLTANGNQGPRLLAPDALERNEFMLDALEDVGARGVTVDIPYPLLDETYPGNDQYLAFYEQVARDVRTRGMTLMIETQVVFTNTPYSPLDIDYSAMSLDDFLAARTRQTVRIARELRPDYLAFSTEQRTDEMLTHQEVSTDRYVRFVDDTITAVGDVKGVALGAGSGSWESPELVQRLAADPLVDFIDVHIYPLSLPGKNLLDAAREMIEIARRNHKRTVIGEAWLYKASATEVAGGIDFVSVVPRDSLAYWAPVDAEFVKTIAQLARSTGTSLVSFYWAQFLFAYPELAATSPTDPRLALAASNAAAAAAMRAGETTPAGVTFRRQALRAGRRHA